MRPRTLRTSIAITKWSLLLFATGVVAFNVRHADAHDGILTRAAAIIFCVYAGHKLWLAFRERKIESVGNPELLIWSSVVYRHSEPFQYWLTVGITIAGLIASIVVAIFGW